MPKWNEMASIDDTIEFLNSLLIIDAVAVTNLVEHRVECSVALTTHPTVQTVGKTVGMLGILNGLFDVDAAGWGPITAVYDDDGTVIIAFKRTDRKDHEALEVMLIRDES